MPAAVAKMAPLVLKNGLRAGVMGQDTVPVSWVWCGSAAP